MADFEFVSHKDEVLKEMEQATVRALETIGLVAERYAKAEISKPKAHKNGEMRPNVDTGRLRNSISHTHDGKDTVYIGTNVEYAPYVEFGTSRNQAYPYLKPAVMDHMDQYRKIWEDELKKA